MTQESDAIDKLMLQARIQTEIKSIQDAPTFLQQLSNDTLVAEATTDAAADILRLDFVRWGTTRPLVR